MFDYSTESGLLYGSKLLGCFVNSDFYDGSEKEELVLTKEEFGEFIRRKAFKDFLVQRERDYTEVARYLAEISYQYEHGFGNTLDINCGMYDAVSLFDSYAYMTPSILTPYDVKSYFNLEEDENLYKGSIEVIQMIGKEGSSMTPYIKSENPVKLEEFDTIFYLNDVEIYRLLSLFRYGILKDKKFIGGIVSNIYDKQLELKLQRMNEIIEEVEKEIGGEILKQDLHSNGSVIKLIHTLY